MYVGQNVAPLLIHSRFCDKKVSNTCLYGNRCRVHVVAIGLPGRILALQTIRVQLGPLKKVDKRIKTAVYLWLKAITCFIKWGFENFRKRAASNRIQSAVFTEDPPPSTCSREKYVSHEAKYH